MRRISPAEEQCARGRSAAPLRSIGPSSVRMPSALEPATGGDQSTIKCKRSRSARRCPARWRCAVGSRSAERCGVAQRTALSCLLVSSPSSAASSARRCLPHCSRASRCLCRGRRCLPPSSTTSCSAQRIALLRKRSAWRCPAGGRSGKKQLAPRLCGFLGGPADVESDAPRKAANCTAVAIFVGSWEVQRMLSRRGKAT